MNGNAPRKPRSISRRAALRGVGATIALPWMESLARATRAPADDAPPVRLACLFFPNGVLDRDWTPAETGPEWTAKSALEPLVPHRDQVHVLSGLRNVNSFAGEGHYVKTTALFSGAEVRRTGGRDLRCGTSFDQLAARELGHRTRLPSMVLGVEPVRNRVDMGYSTVYGANVSWESPTRPAMREIHPRLAFDRLFRSNRRGTDPLDRSVLDLVLQDSRDLQRRLASRDRLKLDEFLESVRETERRIERLDPRAPADLAGQRPPETMGFPAHVELMLDLIALGFRTDTTRIASFMFGNSVSNRDFSFLEGVSGGHHHFSHHENKDEKKRQYSLIVRWHVARFAGLLDRLQATPEGDGNLLDHCVLLMGSGIRDGNAHDPKNVPMLLAGGGGGRLAKGAHHRYRPSPLCNLYVTLLDVFGCPVDRFGDGDRVLPELLNG